MCAKNCNQWIQFTRKTGDNVQKKIGSTIQMELGKVKELELLEHGYELHMK